jgi:hypothetical protein
MYRAPIGACANDAQSMSVPEGTEHVLRSGQGPCNRRSDREKAAVAVEREWVTARGRGRRKRVARALQAGSPSASVCPSAGSSKSHQEPDTLVRRCTTGRSISLGFELAQLLYGQPQNRHPKVALRVSLPELSIIATMIMPRPSVTYSRSRRVGRSETGEPVRALTSYQMPTRKRVMITIIAVCIVP